MTIIDYMRRKLTEYPHISDFLSGDDLHIDFTDPDPANYGLSSNGDSLINRNIRGDEKRQHKFVLYAAGQSFTDYSRLANSNFLLELGYWLEHLPEEDGIDVEVDDRRLQGRFLKATASNAMAMQPMGETVNDGVLYQIQIFVTYQMKGRNHT